MSSERIYVGAFWGPRRESVEACAERLQRHIRGLEQVSPVLSGWYPIGTNKKKREAEGPVTADSMERLVKLLLKGRNRYDTTHEVIEDLGFRRSFSNWKDDDARFSASCGTYAERSHNNALLELPREAGELTSRENLRELVRVHISSWQPDLIRVYRSSILSEKSREELDQGFLDRMLYLAKDIPIPPWIPDSADCEIFEGGKLFIASDI